MKRKLKIIIILIAATTFIIAITFQKDRNTLKASEFYEKTNATNVQLVDIRTSEEYQSGHIKNSVNIDFTSNTFKESFVDFNPQKPLYIYCKTGIRSAKAISILENKGFKFVYDLKGGITAWKEAGYQMITEETNVINGKNLK